MAVLCGKLREVVATLHESASGKCRKVRSQARSVVLRISAKDSDDDVKGERSPIVVRSLSGAVVLETETAMETPISKIIQKVCKEIGAHKDTVQLCSQGQILRHSSRLKESCSKSLLGADDDDEDAPLELTMMRLSGPPITAEARSGKDIQLMDGVPSAGGKCHYDRSYRFISLGDFAKREGMRYLLTSNDDKNMPARAVMWKLEVIVPVVVYLNFRSEGHVRHTGAEEWLRDGDWKRCDDIRGTVSTGVPNGPYQGPVYSKAVDHGGIELMGSNCSEGTYLVFVELHM